MCADCESWLDSGGGGGAVGGAAAADFPAGEWAGGSFFGGCIVEYGCAGWSSSRAASQIRRAQRALFVELGDVSAQPGSCVTVAGGRVFDDVDGLVDALLRGLQQCGLALGGIGIVGVFVVSPVGFEDVEFVAGALCDLGGVGHGLVGVVVNRLDVVELVVDGGAGGGCGVAGVAVPFDGVCDDGFGQGCALVLRGRCGAQELARFVEHGVDRVHVQSIAHNCRFEVGEFTFEPLYLVAESLIGRGGFDTECVGDCGPGGAAVAGVGDGL